MSIVKNQEQQNPDSEILLRETGQTLGRTREKRSGEGAAESSEDQILLTLWHDLGQQLTPAIIFRSQSLSHFV